MCIGRRKIGQWNTQKWEMSVEECFISSVVKRSVWYFNDPQHVVFMERSSSSHLTQCHYADQESDNSRCKHKQHIHNLNT